MKAPVRKIIEVAYKKGVYRGWIDATITYALIAIFIALLIG